MCKKLAILIAAVMLAGCAAYDVQRYGSVDQTNKTVTVQPGGRGLNGALKQALSNEGWRLVVDRGPSITEGKFGESTRLSNYDTFNTKYRLAVSANQYDICFNLSPRINYDVSFINNQTGAEVITVSGSGCESAVVDKFMGALHGS
ncbi:hypothetical protein [Salinisphaera sp. S4-8]|uniref:hypothetical protein n=1 Tax=Salinisphaera sp. S4-8 TaxID=633357 RepID=UPI00333F33A2